MQRTSIAPPRSTTPQSFVQSIRLMYLINQLGYGGAQRLILDLVKNIDRQRFQVTVAMIGGQRPIYDDFVRLGVKTLDFEARGKFDVFALKRLFTYMRQIPVDILHVHSPYAGIVSRLMYPFIPVPALIYTEQNVQSAFHPLTRVGNHLTMPLCNVVTAITIGVEAALFDRSQLFSPEVWQQGQRHFTIYSGVDLDKIDIATGDIDPTTKRAELHLTPTAFVLACVARLHPNKGHTYLIDAMRSIQHTQSNVHLLLLGDGPLEQELEQQIHRLGLEDHITFLGYRRDVYEILAAADAFVLPSIHEGFGIAIAEAMAVGLPVIATTIPAVEEVVLDQRTGLLVPPRNPAALATAITQLANQPALARQLGNNGRQRVEKIFAINTVVRQYEQLYELVMTDLVPA